MWWALLMACGPGSPGNWGGSDGGTTTPPIPTTDPYTTGPTETVPGESHAPTTRRLSNVELEHTLRTVLGVTPEALSLLPPDSHGYIFDRVVASQTMSRAHLDAAYAIGEEAAQTLLEEGRLAELTPACEGVDLPPLVGSTTSRLSGVELTLGPGWSVGVDDDDPSIATTIYAPDPIASASLTFPADGTYEVGLELVSSAPIQQLEVRFEGDLVSTMGVDGATTVTVDVDAIAGPGVIDYHLITTPENHNLAVDYVSVTVEGPLDTGDPAGRRDCAVGLVDDVGARLFRRPLSDDEAERLVGLYDDAEGAAAFELLLVAMIASPHTLYLVEVGEEVEPGQHELTPWEQAARLSYALCEEPPDPQLREAVRDGSFAGPDALEAHARRLLESPCGQRTVERFVAQWLHLRELDGLNKSPDAYPGFDQDTLDGLMAESSRYTYEMVYPRQATLFDFFTSDVAWPDPRSSWLMGLSVSTQEETPLPDERRGVLAQPSLLAVTAGFEGTSPVERGVFVLEQLLCAELPPPPADLMVTPPEPDPSLTTRERWAQHSDSPACAGCHELIDPIGFSFEAFDGVGGHRDTENGLPIDTSGGVPSIGVEDGELDGLVDIGFVLAESEALPRCFATQWLRSSLGRLDDPRDAGSLATVIEAAATDPLLEAMVAWVRTPAFIRRYDSLEATR